jgi:nucleoside-diphosphate-sugar epimerase
MRADGDNSHCKTHAACSQRHAVHVYLDALFFDYRRQHDLRVKDARIFNTYGPPVLRW